MKKVLFGLLILVFMVMAIEGQEALTSRLAGDLSRAKILYAKGRTDEALVLLREVIRIIENSSPGFKEQHRNILTDAYFTAGLCFFAKGNRALAKGMFKKALNYDPNLTVDEKVYGAQIKSLVDEARGSKPAIKEEKRETKSEITGKEIAPPPPPPQRMSVPSYSKFGFEKPAPKQMLFVNAGLSMATGGLGMNLEFQADRLSLLGGIGVWPSSFSKDREVYKEYGAPSVIMGWAVGGKFYLNKIKNSPYIGITFGKLVYEETLTCNWWTGETTYESKSLNGISVFGGYRVLVNGRHPLTFGIGVGYAFGEIPEWASSLRYQLALDITFGLGVEVK